MFKIDLGDEVKDNVTGFSGMVIARVECLNGCIRYEVQPKKLKDSKIIGSEWVDEGQLKITKKIEVKTEKTKAPGGSRIAPPKLSTPEKW